MADPQRVRSIFLEAVEHHAPDQWSSFLDQSCGDDPELRKRVEVLLRAHEQANSMLDVAAAPPRATIDQPAAETPGIVIGPYKLIEQIGEGGMGTVWMAQQTEPVKRVVALKLIKAGMDSRQVIARFDAERQALALMDHPNIARVLDAGTTGAGRPYFVMDLVKGVPITKYCDEHYLTPRQRLELFIPVCQAVQHAHQKGIIHRDLKPSNILVALYDGKPVPKVIDFGVAKATGQALTDKTLITGFGNIVGTLEYMSPEQAEVNQLDIDTRSDIYSLGVLLYELLAGSTPFSRKELEKAGMLEMLRVIREQEPSKPSTKLSTAEGLPTLAANRGTEPAKLTRLVRGELDWIVMKALEKDRNRRYETANGFAADVQRYLNDEMVQACRPSGWYQFRKFARRNRVGLSVAGLILFFVIALGGGAGWAISDKATRRAQTANDVNRVLAEAKLLQSQQKYPEALAAVTHAEVMLTNSGGVDGNLDQDVREYLSGLELIVNLENASLRAADVKDGNLDREQADAAYAKAFRDYGVDLEALLPTEAGALFRARGIGLEVATAVDSWVWTRSWNERVCRNLLALACAADPDPFRDRVRDVVARRDQQGLADLAASDQIYELPGSTLCLLARREGQPEVKGIVPILKNAQRRHPGDFWINVHLAAALADAKPARNAEAVRFYTAALAVRPSSPVVLNNLGDALDQSGASDEAIAAFREAIRIKSDFAMARYNLGGILLRNRQLDAAITELQEAVRLKPGYASAHGNLGVALHDNGHLDGAIVEQREAIRLKPDDAAAHYNLALDLHDKGKVDEAIAEYRQAIRLQPDYAEAHNSLGVADFDRGEVDEAIAEYRDAIRLKPDYATAHTNLGAMLYLKGHRDDALLEIQRAIHLDPDLDVAHMNLGNALAGNGQLDDAIAEYREALRLKWDYAEARTNLAKALTDKGDFENAIAEYREVIRQKPDYAAALNGLAWLLATCPDEKLRDPKRAVELGKTAVELAPSEGGRWNTVGVAHCRAGNWKAGCDALEKSMELHNGGNSFDWFFLAMARWQLGDKQDARKWFDQAVEWMEKNEPKNEELLRFRSEAERVLGLPK